MVEIIADDGLRIAGTFTAAVGESPHPGVILFHMLGSDRSVWEGFSQVLSQQGFASLAIDLRGHGDSGDEPDLQMAQADLKAVWEYFSGSEDIAEDQIALVGASIGANLALLLGADVAQITGVVLLSPGLNYQGVVTDQAMLAYAGRPALIVASAEDSYSVNSSRTLQQLGGEAVELQLYRDAGHGTDMMAAQPELADLIIAWLKERLG
jgi:alpha-beta hydrolase superfamily lysophospholipase